ncbi:MAG: AAC(3) family N-acetyltransferase [Clostridia bacterium]|nr:AAC(3) family N-acetyltransferase [Clostridia bacterium]
MTTKQMLFEQLDSMKIPKNTVIHMHSSLKAIGEFEGNAEGLLDALAEYITAEGGLFTVPTHTWANIGKTEITLDMTTDFSCVGAFTRVAASHKDAHRSMHPTHSMAVFGDAVKAEDFIKCEKATETTSGKDGCYGKLYTMGGKVLLVGVGHERNTYLHAVEEMLGVNRLSKGKMPFKVRKKDGTVIDRPIYSYVGAVSKYFPKFEPAFRYFGCITDGFIGNAPAQLCDCRGMLEVIKLLYEKSGTDLLCDDKPICEKLYK